ncbi:MAG: hypothetical protein K6E81_09325 [Lachnospiraceae bacterium]|nr:hypothetical protein [Lachnospiraceae bacterium]
MGNREKTPKNKGKSIYLQSKITWQKKKLPVSGGGSLLSVKMTKKYLKFVEKLPFQTDNSCVK